MFGTIGSFVGNLFGTQKSANKLIDGISNGLDKIFYTEEEKADAAQKSMDFVLEWYKATSGSHLGRRWMAIQVSAMWCIFLLVFLVLGISLIFTDPDTSEKILVAMELLGRYFWQVTTALGVILAFYFTTKPGTTIFHKNDTPKTKQQTESFPTYKP